jgi:hypothetical protein
MRLEVFVGRWTRLSERGKKLSVGGEDEAVCGKGARLLNCRKGNTYHLYFVGFRHY